jgi:Rhs element Vgr protein
MPVSPRINAQALVSLSVFSNGQALADTVRIVSVRVTRAVNAIPSARLVMLDGDPATGQWPLADAPTFAPGALILIKAGYAGADTVETLFEGIVVKLGLRVGAEAAGELVIDCQDRAVTMTVGPKSANYIGLTDDAIITKLASAHGLTVSVDPTTPTSDARVQYYCTDWDFLVSRAEAHGLLAIATDGNLSVKAPAVAGEAALEVTWGEDLSDFEAEIDARGQFAEVKATSWDPSTQALESATSGPADLNPQGNLSSARLAEVMGLDSFTLQTAARLETEALGGWARARQVKAGLARIRGRMTFQGSALARVGGLISLKGVGARFEGSVFVAGLTHRIEAGSWTTQAEFGVPDGSAARPEPAAPILGGLSGVQGLQVGVVVKLDGDPAGEQRIQVSAPVLNAETPEVWARLIQPFASQGFGAFCIPEIGDEVALGYFDNDPSNPVILGGLYSRPRAPPYPVTADNNLKGFVTRSRTRIEIDDAAKALTISTPGGNRVVISDQDQSTRLADQNGNVVTLGPEGILLNSPKDITLTADGSISLNATGAISVKAQADLTATGLNVTAEAQAALTARGAATAELSASGQTTVKGAMVMIN